jgi:hypothetical protein
VIVTKSHGEWDEVLGWFDDQHSATDMVRELAIEEDERGGQKDMFAVRRMQTVGK